MVQYWPEPISIMQICVSPIFLNPMIFLNFTCS